MQRSSVVFVIAVLLAGCGGGGGTVTPPASTLPNSPAAGSGSIALAPPAHYRIVDLGANAMPMAINAHNEVAGTIGTASNPAAGIPFRYQNGALTKLQLPAGVSGATVNDLNDNGDIVGTDGHALKWAADGTVSDLGVLPNTYTSFVVIDDEGDILGLSPLNLGIAGCGGSLTQFFTNAPPQALGGTGLSLAINGAGVAAFGSYSQTGSGCQGTVSPALYPRFTSPPVPSDFTLDALGTFVTDINDSDAVIGYGPTTAFPDGATFYSQGSSAIEIDPPASDNALQGNGLNDKGWIVGTMFGATSRHAFLWVSGKTIDLNSLLPANCGWTLNNGTDINDSGYIIGTGTLSGATHGFLLIPS